MTLLRTILAFLAAGLGLLAILPILLALAPALAVAAATRWIAARIEPRSAPWDALVQYEPVIGWRPRPLLDTHGRVEDVFHIVTDADGWRGRCRLDDAEVVVVGDSFAFGQGMDEEDMYANLLERPRIKPVGSNGYNMVQELLWLRRLGGRLAGKLVVWFVFHGNDLCENLQPNLQGYRMPFVRRPPGGGGWEIVTGHVSQEPWTVSRRRKYYERLAEICCPTELSRRALSACDFLIAEGRQSCLAYGARLAVVTIPEVAQLGGPRLRALADLSPDPGAFDPALPDRVLGETCRRRGIPFLPLREHLGREDYKARDIHWTREGHRKVATLLEALHRECEALDVGWPAERPRTSRAV